jgi:AraC-like DNA-binding protein
MYSQISILRNHIHLAVDFGADFNELCRRMKIDPSLLNDGESHAEWEPGQDSDFWLRALEMTGIPTLGLQMGQKPNNMNAFGMLGLLAGSCKNVREAIETVCRYNDTLTSVFKFIFHMGEDEGTFVFNPHPLWEQLSLESARQAVDMFMSGWTKAFHDATGKKIHPIRAELRYTPRFEKEYKEILQTELVFNRKDNLFIVSKEYLSTPIAGYDQSLYAIFTALLQQKQRNLETRSTFAQRIRQVLISKFNGQITHIDMVASQLCMTTRTLQRKLTEENTSYRKICNDLRKELASDLLRAGKSKKSEVASLLGYSNIDALNRALRA